MECDGVGPVSYFACIDFHKCKILNYSITQQIKNFSGDYGIPKNVAFESKIDTDLYEFAKNKTYITSMNLSPDGKFFATFGADKKIRVFRFLMGKLYCVIGKNML